ncbi:hypothetical protein [Celeribacter naphthalenivorans]|uniref:hypothetical protein n=1 Tax=Celeribacter naphthalenivorans TaxID=1614694 RepID=UPI001CF9F7F8|nr:hypothetical protein [Celeribacter naphthalenivorans]
MIKFNQGEFPIYLAKQHIIAVKPNLDGETLIVTTAAHGPRVSPQDLIDGVEEQSASFVVNESIEEVISAIEADSN